MKANSFQTTSIILCDAFISLKCFMTLSATRLVRQNYEIIRRARLSCMFMLRQEIISRELCLG